MIKMLNAQLIFTTIGVLLWAGSVTEAQNAPCTATMYSMDLRSCFRIHMDRDVRMIIHDKPTVVETSLQTEGFMDDPNNVCHEEQTFAKLFDCLGGTTTKCVTESAEMKYLPNATLTRQGLEYFCSHVDDIDTGCYNESYGEVFECVKKLSAQFLKSNDSAATKACTTVDITHDCIHANVLCDEKTRDLLLKFQDEYRKPSACPAPARSDRKKYIVTGSATAVLVSKLFCFCLSFFIILLQSD
ncbi:uncharacterized protein [Littorina saxatilis]|uniref:Uncharacterized protein n=1 Tax=Littorina saxatilis TaxID=31220 RepID=A0AAN9ANL8_9CAEN